MNLLRKTSMCLGGLALMALLLAVAFPRPVHAITAALVQVVNTTANPVPNVDVNAPGAEPFQTTLCADSGSSSGICAASHHVGPAFTVPTTTTDGLVVKRLVVENVSGSCGQTGGGLAWIFFSFPESQNVVNNNYGVGSVVPAPTFINGLAGFSQPTRMYLDPGSTLSALTVSQGGGVRCDLYVAGYFVTK